MQASSKFTISIHMCIYLEYSEEDLVSSQTLADSVKTNPVVIRRLVGLLRKHGIVQSVTGSKGGFKLAKPVNKINLWDIYLAVKDEGFFNKPKVNPDCKVSSNLGGLVDDVYSKAELSMKPTLEKCTIDQLTDNLHQLLGGAPLTEC